MPLNPKIIARRREQLELSQEEAAQRAGMLRSNWARIESGMRCNPSLRTAEHIALALRCKLTALLRKR